MSEARRTPLEPVTLCPGCRVPSLGYCALCLQLGALDAKPQRQPCEWCGGHGYVERMVSYSGDPGWTREVPCSECGGTGEARK